ncbi:MAG: H-NS histone family protein [Rubrivivax sp.]
MASLTELLAQRAELEKQIERTQREERESALNQIRQLMSQYGLTLTDLGGRSGATKTPRAAGGSGGRSGAKVAAKYRDVQTGDTWSGRGLQPRWLKAALAGGKKLSDFAV